jgi:hypothetical protein
MGLVPVSKLAVFQVSEFFRILEKLPYLKIVSE